MAQTVQLKRSAVANKVPLTTDLALGELALNTYDGKLYTKKNVSGTETVVNLNLNAPAPEDYGAVGDGVTNDTAAVLAWLNAGGGRAPDVKKIYLIDPISVSVSVNVYANCTFKQRSGWTSWTGTNGLIKLTGASVVWLGSTTFDGNRDDTAVNAGMTAILGSNTSTISLNQYKSELFIDATTNSIVVDIGDITVRNAIGHGVNLIAPVGKQISGRISSVTVANSAAVMYADRCRDLTFGDIRGVDLDCRIGGNNEYFFPFLNNGVMLIRNRRCPVRSVSVKRQRGRPGRWYTAASFFITAVTQSSCTDSPIGTVDVRDAWWPLTSSSDAPSGSIAADISTIGFSDVGNVRCGVAKMYVDGDWTLGFELVPGGGSFYGDVTLKSLCGRQGVDRGSSAISIHGSQRHDHNAGSGGLALRPETRLDNMHIEGYVIGVLARTNNTSIGNLMVRGCRRDGVVLTNLGIVEWDNGQTEKAVLTIDQADIQWCGGTGVRAVSGGQLTVKTGVITNNEQSSGYTDPTIWTGDTPRSYTSAFMYDSADTNSSTVDSIIMIDVKTDSNIASYSSSTGASFLPRSQLPGSSSTINDPRINVMAMTFKDMTKVNIGQRFQIQNVDVTGVTDVDVWVRAIYGNLVLVEVSTAYTGAWSDATTTTALSGTWSITATSSSLAATGVGGSLYTQITGPCFIKTSQGYILLERMDTTTHFYYQSSDVFGTNFDYTLAASVTADTFYKIDTGFAYTQRQTTRGTITHANVAVAQDIVLVSESGTQTLTNKTLSSPVLTGTLTANSGVGTAGQVLTSNGSAVYWSTVTGGSGGGATNLTTSANGSTVSVFSDTGTDIVLTAANSTIAGVLTAEAQTIAGVKTFTSNVSVSTVTAGTWNGSLISSTYGGTGVNNGSSTITLGGNLTTSGAFATTLTATGSTNITLPTTGTLATLAGAETLSNKTMSGSVLTGTLTANGSVGTAGQVLASNTSGTYWTTHTSITVGTIAPSSPSIGDLWVDTN